MEVRPAPSSWKWNRGIVGWMIFDGDEQVAWIADEKIANAVAEFLAYCKQHPEEQIIVGVPRPKGDTTVLRN